MILATLCYLQSDGKTLMLRRGKKKGDFHKGKWNGLGGKLEMGESPEECVIREVQEESGLQITSPNLKGIITFPLFDGRSDWHCFIYTAEHFSGTMLTDSPEGDLTWIPTHEIMELELWPGDYKFLPWVFDDRFFTAKFCYESKLLRDFSVSFY